MKVKEVIELLKKCDPEATATVWDPIKDRSVSLIFVSKSNIDSDVHIGSEVYGLQVSSLMLPFKKTK